MTPCPSVDRVCRRFGRVAFATLALAAGLYTAPSAHAVARAATEDALEGIVKVRSFVPAEARTADSLGTEREGTGVVIDDSGLVATIGYIILEAIEVEIEGIRAEPISASIVGYDHESGFGLLRAGNLGVEPIALGDSDAIGVMQPLLAVSQVDGFDAAGVYVVDRREFAGYWEYLLEDAIFTAPPQSKFGGAALLDQEGRLVGIGSLLVNDAGYRGRPIPGNMFVPINHLKSIMGDMLAHGRRNEPAHPWLGVTLEEHRGRVFVTRVSPDGPAEAAGIERDDVILGVDGVSVDGLADLYRKLWATGDAGVRVELDVLKDLDVVTTSVDSGDRYRYLRLDPTY